VFVFVCAQLLAMVPQPVLAVLLLYPITKESEEANKKGEGVCINAAAPAAVVPCTHSTCQQD
jgi:hypothetical protein